MAFPGSKSRCSNFCVLSFLSPSYIQGSHRRMPPPDRGAFSFCQGPGQACPLGILAFPSQLLIPPTFTICPSCPHSDFHPFLYRLPPTLHSLSYHIAPVSVSLTRWTAPPPTSLRQWERSSLSEVCFASTKTICPWLSGQDKPNHSHKCL